MERAHLVHSVAKQHHSIVVDRISPILSNTGGPPHKHGVAQANQ